MLFTVVLGAVHLGSGVLGWFVDGLLVGTPMAIPLGRPDNVFHLLVGGAGATVLASPLRAGHRKQSVGGADRAAP